MAIWLAALMVLQGATAQASEVRKTETKSVEISDVRYKGADSSYPKPRNFEEQGVGHTYDGARLCNAAHDLLADESMPTKLLMESIIVKAAGIDLARDNEDAVKRKATAWLAGENGRSACPPMHILRTGNASWMQAMIQPSFDGYRIVDQIILRYGLPLNDVAAADGRTILDYIADKIDTISDARSDRYRRIYGTLRRFGAKHRKELEIAGEVLPPKLLLAKYEGDLVKQAESGDLKSMWALTNDYASTGSAAKATEWLEKTLSAARSGGDVTMITQIGLRFVDVQESGVQPFSGRRAEGIALLEWARQADNRNTTFGLMDDRDFALGWAYLNGKGVRANEPLGLKLLSDGRNPSGLRLAAGYLLDRGRRAEAIAYLRSVRGPGGHWAFRDGKTIVEWLEAQPEGLCGRDSHGTNPCD